MFRHATERVWGGGDVYATRMSFVCNTDVKFPVNCCYLGKSPRSTETSFIYWQFASYFDGAAAT